MACGHDDSTINIVLIIIIIIIIMVSISILEHCSSAESHLTDTANDFCNAFNSLRRDLMIHSVA